MSLEVNNLNGGRRLLIGVLIFLLVSLFAINSFISSQFYIISSGYSTNQEAPSITQLPEQNGYLVYKEGCHIPDLSSMETSVRRYIGKAEPIVCKEGNLPLVESNNSAIFINPEARPHYYNDSKSKINCCWRSLWRSGNRDDNYTISKDCHQFQESALINDEFIQVECYNRNGSIYRDYFAFVPRKLYVEERCWKQLRNYSSFSKGSMPPRKLNVIIVGVDAVSRLNLHRLMPQTVKLLAQMGAVEMLGYNKVADNTYPNLVPVLSGLSQDEFEKLCWTNHKNPFDNCPLLWKNFTAKGYRTVFGEDACSMTIFNYLKPGFRKQPTDYYLRPFCVAAEADIGNTHTYNAHLCLGRQLNFKQLLHYIRKVADEFADDPYFAFFWQASLTHDDIEYPQLGDDAYHDLFSYFDKNDLLRNTALVFMSDHGMRWGTFRQTYQGRLEDSLPFVFLRLPDWWKNLYPNALDMLKKNTRSLTTPYDLHETLRDLLDPSRLLDQNDISNSITQRKPSRGLSMFKPIPDNRTCETAGISEHWCMCHSRRNVSRDDPVLPKITSYVISEINKMLINYSQCAQIKLESIVDAKAINKLDKEDEKITDDVKKAPWTDYSVTFQTKPGSAIFEGSIRYKTNETLSLIGSISRLNAYGNQSACVDDFHMKLYCYCQFGVL